MQNNPKQYSHKEKEYICDQLLTASGIINNMFNNSLKNCNYDEKVIDVSLLSKKEKEILEINKDFIEKQLDIVKLYFMVYYQCNDSEKQKDKKEVTLDFISVYKNLMHMRKIIGSNLTKKWGLMTDCIYQKSHNFIYYVCQIMINNDVLGICTTNNICDGAKYFEKKYHELTKGE